MVKREVLLSRGKLEQKLYIKKIFGQILLKQVSSKILIPQRRFHNRQIPSGSLGRNKIEGTLYINQRTRTVAFVNKSNSKCRTIIKMSDKQLQRLIDQNYYLFPKV